MRLEGVLYTLLALSAVAASARSVGDSPGQSGHTAVVAGDFQLDQELSARRTLKQPPVDEVEPATQPLVSLSFAGAEGQRSLKQPPLDQGAVTARTQAARDAVAAHLAQLRAQKEGGWDERRAAALQRQADLLARARGHAASLPAGPRQEPEPQPRAQIKAQPQQQAQPQVEGFEAFFQGKRLFIGPQHFAVLARRRLLQGIQLATKLAKQDVDEQRQQREAAQLKGSTMSDQPDALSNTGEEEVQLQVEQQVEQQALQLAELSQPLLSKLQDLAAADADSSDADPLGLITKSAGVEGSHTLELRPERLETALQHQDTQAGQDQGHALSTAHEQREAAQQAVQEQLGATQSPPPPANAAAQPVNGQAKVQTEVQEGSIAAAAERFGVGAGHRELVQDLSRLPRSSGKAVARERRAQRRMQAKRRAGAQAFHLGEDPLEGLDAELATPQDQTALPTGRTSSLSLLAFSGVLLWVVVGAIWVARRRGFRLGASRRRPLMARVSSQELSALLVTHPGSGELSAAPVSPFQVASVSRANSGGSSRPPSPSPAPQAGRRGLMRSTSSSAALGRQLSDGMA